ncbi:MAG: penicillin-binding protein 1B [Gammaproteobacteria bacterium]|nr:penicillin-binding protein 1B [Gammaproteobacteria bacterium]
MFFKRTEKKDSSIKKKVNQKTKKSGANKKKAKVKQDTKKQPMMVKLFYMFFYLCVTVGVVGVVGLWLYSIELDRKYKLSEGALDGVLWELPSRVYARPLDLYEGKALTLNNLKKELLYLNYVADPAVSEPGTYHIDGKDILIYKKAFNFWDGEEEAGVLRVTIKNNKVSGLFDLTKLAPIAITRLEPLLIGSIYPKHSQDRVLINLDNTPEILVDSIIATEDRRFYSHPGIDPKGLARALFQAIKQGRVKQGASTLTQQFVKNHYLTRERTISRKVKEALISIILEANYTKKQILEGYLNEIFLGQDGGRAIHGFGLASDFYFGKPLKDLGVHQIASLVALVREPARANPFKHPQYAKKRRSIILDVMVLRNLIAKKDAELAKTLPLDVLPKAERAKKDRYYSFLQLAYKKIHENYDGDKLAAGLNVFTTLDPIIQEQTEDSIASSLKVLEKRKGLSKNFLQAASVVVNSATAEVVAIVGDRDSKRHGFNRAIQAKRQPGSLLKPVVYMAALEYPQKYTLSTLIDDSPLEYRSGGEVWKPKNYSRGNKENVMLIDGLVKSYNIPTARIALDIGINDVIDRLEDLGAREGLPEYPSIVLGAVTMTPLEVTEIYESLANGGYRMPLRVINSITDAYGEPVKRYPMESVQVISKAPYYLTIKAMQGVVNRGTAASMNSTISSKLNIAGKTGTTDDYRDSWFAGFSGNYLNVVWVGNDDNKKTGLSGSGGALKVWMSIMKKLPLKPLDVNIPSNVTEIEVDASDGKLVADFCRKLRKTVTLPFIKGSEPVVYSDCEEEFEAQRDIELESYDDDVEDSNSYNIWYNH